MVRDDHGIVGDVGELQDPDEQGNLPIFSLFGRVKSAAFPRPDRLRCWPLLAFPGLPRPHGQRGKPDGRLPPPARRERGETPRRLLLRAVLARSPAWSTGSTARSWPRSSSRDHRANFPMYLTDS